MAMSLEPGELLRGGSGCPLTDRVPSGGPNPLYCNVHRVPKARGSAQPSRSARLARALNWHHLCGSQPAAQRR